MDKDGIYKGLKDKLGKIPSGKRTQYLVIVVMIAVILAIYFSTFTPGSSAQPQSTVNQAIEKTENTSAGTDLNLQVASILSAIQGAGEVRVMITYESGSEIVPATSENTETTTTQNSQNGSSQTSETVKKQSDVVTVQNQSNSSALVLKEKTPEIKGIIVIAQGAGDIGVKMNILKAVETLLNVSADKVDVFKMQIK